MPEGTLRISGAMLVTPEGMRRGGVLAEGGRIAALLGAEDAPSADIAIDAKGLLLFPGFVDAHAHLRDPGLTHKEDFATGTTAAACGGVTTVLCMPNTSPPTTDIASLSGARAAAEGRVFVDIGLQASLAAGNLDQAESLWRAGAVSFEVNLSDGAEGAGVARLGDAGLLRETLRETARLGAVLGAYTGSQDITARLVAQLQAEGRRDARAHAAARPPIAEVLGIAGLLELAREAEARVCFREVTTARAFDLLRRARAERPAGAVLVEATPHHLLLTDAVLDSLGTVAQIIPPLRAEADRAGAMAALQAGVIDFIGSDHAPHAIAEKTGDAWASRNGTPGLDTLAAATLEMVARGLLTYPDVARLLAEAPARAFGLTRKGRIAPGCDADLVLVDPTARRVVAPDMLHSKMKRCAFEGVALRGWPVLTVLRGIPVAQDGALLPGSPRGRVLDGAGAAPSH
jgi:dihydroorotase (multifunctional complex type)